MIVACSVPGAGGVSPTGASGRIVFDGTQSLLVNSATMTIALRFRTQSVLNATAKGLVAKAPQALNDNQWLLQFDSNLHLDLIVANAAGDFSNGCYTSASLAVATEYVAHVVYDGAQAAANRVRHYLQGLPVATNVAGTIPTSMRVGGQLLSALNRSGGSTGAPDTDFVLRSVNIYKPAFSAADVAADYINNLAAGVTP